MYESHSINKGKILGLGRTYYIYEGHIVEKQHIGQYNDDNRNT